MLCANKLGALGVLIGDAMQSALGTLSGSAAALLLTLHDRPGITATQAAKVAGIAQPTAVRVLDGLVRQGWVVRLARVGRTTPLQLTGAGRRQAKSLQGGRLQALANILAALPEPESAAFERSLDRLLAGATTSRAFARTTCRLCDHETCKGKLCPVGSRASELERRSR